MDWKHEQFNPQRKESVIQFYSAYYTKLVKYYDDLTVYSRIDKIGVFLIL